MNCIFASLPNRTQSRHLPALKDEDDLAVLEAATGSLHLLADVRSGPSPVMRMLLYSKNNMMAKVGIQMALDPTPAQICANVLAPMPVSGHWLL